MKKLLFPALALVLSTACRQDPAPENILQTRVDSLQGQLKNVYVPGFGELMLNVQIHHAKLWFAGRKENWLLAAYEESLIRSALRKISVYHQKDPNARFLPMLTLPLDSLDAAIVGKDPARFNRGFLFLTTGCNNCHQVTNHAFNVIVVPKKEPIGNQQF